MAAKEFHTFRIQHNIIPESSKVNVTSAHVLYLHKYILRLANLPLNSIRTKNSMGMEHVLYYIPCKTNTQWHTYTWKGVQALRNFKSFMKYFSKIFVFNGISVIICLQVFYKLKNVIYIILLHFTKDSRFIRGLTSDVWRNMRTTKNVTVQDETQTDTDRLGDFLLWNEKCNIKFRRKSMLKFCEPDMYR